MLLAHLILAHLLADFVLQPSKLVRWKMRSTWGVAVHVTIHLAVMTLVLLPFILNGYLWTFAVIGGVTIFHFIIDQSKISYDLRHDKKVRPFVIDQILHFCVISIAYLLTGTAQIEFPETRFYELYTSTRVLIFLALLIGVSQVIEIYKFQKIREHDRRATFRLDSHEATKRMLVLTIVYLFYMVFSFAASSGYVMVP